MSSRGADTTSGPAPARAIAHLTDEALRDALRPPDLPLPAPTTVLGAARRIHDLSALGRRREALAISAAFAHEPAPLTERVELLREHAAVLRADGREEDARAVLREMVMLIAGAGLQDHARAAHLVHGLGAGTAGTDAEPPPAARAPVAPTGRRRLAAPDRITEDDVDEAVLVVVRGIAHPVPAAGAGLDPRQLEAEEGRMLSALAAYPEARAEILGDPEPLLRLRYAQVLQRQGRHEEASFQASAVLEELEAREDRDGTVDVERSGTMAHAILAASLRPEDPAAAAAHAVAALRAMHDVDDPVRRIDLICELVEDLVVGGMAAEAAYASRRLASLLRTLPDPALRVRPLRTIAAERIAAGAPEAAREPLTEAARLARADRDHRSLLRIHRLGAEGLRREGRSSEALDALRRAASHARSLSDDLGAGPEDRRTFQRAELELRGDALRLALEADLPAQALAEAHEVLLRLDRTSWRPVLPRAELWEHEVDARVGAMIAASLTAVDPLGAEAPSNRAVRRARARRTELHDEARQAIAAAPEGAEERRRYWEVYLDDRSAEMLERLGDGEGARQAAARARDGWADLDEDAHRERVEEQLDRLAADG